MKPSQKIWYAVYTKPRAEKKVASALTEQEILHYLPLVKKYRQWSDRRKTVEEPLFNSYVFVCITEKEHLQVLRTFGVVRFITFEGKKIPVREVEIEAIRKYVDTGEEFLENEADFIPGKRVKVVRGQFKDLTGNLVQVLGKQRVKVEIESVGKAIYLKIPIGSLELK